MKNKNVFEKNAKIPDVVQQKANAAFREIYTRQDEPKVMPQKAHKEAWQTAVTPVPCHTWLTAAPPSVVTSRAKRTYNHKGGERKEEKELFHSYDIRGQLSPYGSSINTK